ncbi:MAG: DUF2799 domain-containing protein [Gallionella sp.]|nr:DUF2799 domain-containing protein [Gallionella sp.]
MNRLFYTLAMLWLAGTLAGCASMSKKDCETADWRTIGYNDGARGIYFTHLDSYRKRCSEYQITPDANAYQTGWNQGIRSYCTSDNGYRAGVAGQAFQNVCPADVAPGYRVGWQQGIRQYCTPDNGLRQGLAGYPYRGVCPSDMAIAFQKRYRLGRDLRQAQANHHNIEYKLDRVRKGLAAEKDPHRYHDLLEELAHLRHEEDRSEFNVGALQACTNDDWFEVGLSDGESGSPYQAREIARLCRSYGSGEDMPGYRDGWSRGNNHYCSFDSGLYAGQNNQEYRGVCHGPRYVLFWSGYLRGIGLFKAGRYEDHPRPQYQHEERHQRKEQHTQQNQYRELAPRPAHGSASQPAARGGNHEQPNRNGFADFLNPSDQSSNRKPAPENVQHAPANTTPAPENMKPSAKQENRKPTGKPGNSKPAAKPASKKPAKKQKSKQSDHKQGSKPDHQDNNGKPADEQHPGDARGASSSPE